MDGILMTRIFVGVVVPWGVDAETYSKSALAQLEQQRIITRVELGGLFAHARIGHESFSPARVRRELVPPAPGTSPSGLFGLAGFVDVFQRWWPRVQFDTSGGATILESNLGWARRLLGDVDHWGHLEARLMIILATLNEGEGKQ